MVIYLERDLNQLPTAGRPVSQSTDLQELWRKREPLYAAFADWTVDNAGTVADAADKIEKELSRR